MSISVFTIYSMKYVSIFIRYLNFILPVDKLADVNKLLSH